MRSSPPSREHLGGNTSKAIGSQSSHTPPPRPVRERMEFPNEISSERTLSTSRERLSALARIAEPDLRHTSPRIFTRRISLPPREHNERGSGSDHRGETEDSSSQRVPASLRLQEPPPQVDSVNITIPPTQSKAAGIREVAVTPRKRVLRSPMQALKLRKTSGVKSSKPARRKLGLDKDYNLPCNKARSTIIPRSTITRSQQRKQKEGQDFHPPPPPLP